MLKMLEKYLAVRAPEIGAGSGTDLSGGSFNSISDAVGSYSEDAGPQYTLDDDAEDGDDGQGDRRGARQDGSDGPQHQGDDQQAAEDQDDLDKLLSGLDPEAGSEDGEGADQGDPNQQPQAEMQAAKAQLENERRQFQEERQTFTQERQRFETARTQVRQQYEAMQGNMEMLAAVAQALMPQEPDIGMLGVDQNGYHILRNAYDKQVAMIGQVRSAYQQMQQAQTEQQAAAREEFRMEQAQKLVQRDPRFGQNEFWNNFQRDMFSYGPRVYGYTADELRDGMLDHRQFEVLRDAIEYQKIKAAVKARKGVKNHQDARQRGAQQQPRDQRNGQYVPSPQGRVVTGSGVRGRVDPAAMQRQAAEARFKKNPTMKNAVDLID